MRSWLKRLRLVLAWFHLQRINKLREEDPKLCLRIEVDGGGCQGFQYNFKLDQLSAIDTEVDRLVSRVTCV